MELRIRPARAEDAVEIAVLAVSAFGQNNEARLIEALRRDGKLAVELVAETDEGLTGHVALSWLEAPAGWLALAPVCVRPPDQGRGVGAELIRYGLDAARRAGGKAVVVVGDPDYYHRFGFVFGGRARLSSPYPAAYTGLYPIDPATAAAQVALAYPTPFEEV